MSFVQGTFIALGIVPLPTQSGVRESTSTMVSSPSLMLFAYSMTSASPMVSTPGASFEGWMQNGGHLREVFANAGFTVFFWSWLRMMVIVSPPCMTSTDPTPAVICTATSSAPTGAASTAATAAANSDFVVRIVNSSLRSVERW